MRGVLGALNEEVAKLSTLLKENEGPLSLTRPFE